MNAGRRLIRRLLALLLLGGALGCVGTVGFSGDRYEAGYVDGIYEPFGYEYGGWGPDYRVGPPRGGDDRGRLGTHGFQGAPSSRATPSIPGGRPSPGRPQGGPRG
jgi:hypothetical protein